MKLEDLTVPLMEKALELERGQRDYEGAISVYTTLIKIDPGKYVYYFNRGVLYAYLDEVDRAIADYSKALELNPRHITSRMNRAVAYKDKGDIEKAIAETEKCVEMAPDGLAQVNLPAMYQARAENERRLQRREEGPLTWLLRKLRLRS